MKKVILATFLLFVVSIMSNNLFAQVKEDVTKQNVKPVVNTNNSNFVDKNNNGICDNYESKVKTGKCSNFVDKDGDGICDNKGKNCKNANCKGNCKGQFKENANGCGNGCGFRHRHGNGHCMQNSVTK